jgi:hypothetical protein
VSDIGILRGLCAGIPDPTTKRIITEICEELVGKGGLTFGDPDHQRRATNHRLFFETSTTAASTGEFSIRHGLATAPTLAIPVLDLGQPGAQFVPLTVTREADNQRVYLKSGSTGARITLLVE